MRKSVPEQDAMENGREFRRILVRQMMMSMVYLLEVYP